MANLEYFSDEDVISFTLLDAHTVERLQRDGDIKLPRKKVDIPKDERWNTKQMSSKLLQGILTGDAIPTIANSLMQVIGNNAAAAVRNARTMVTGAENVGRLDSYEDLAEKGVVQKKVWIATADDRTRESHLLLDGEEVDIDKPFSNGLMYPADPSGDPAEVYNCRCSMRDHIVGFRRADGSISYVGAERDTTSHAGKIEDEIAQRGLERVAEAPAAPAESDRTVVNGSNISGSWTRRPDEFDFEIEDVINAQGFDGLPKVVPADKFNRYVEESNIIMQRAYTAPDQETLMAYQNELYNGKWYVDCSTGGHMYGRGMYADGRYATSVNDTMKATMDGYGGVDPNGIVETFTLTTDAKIIDYKDIDRLRQEYGQAQLSELLNLNDMPNEERLFILSQAGFTNTQETMIAMNWVSDNSSKVGDIYKTYITPNAKTIGDIRSNAFSMDEGVIATLNGYDAINCESVSENGEDGYFVILNRTKIIFKGE